MTRRSKRLTHPGAGDHDEAPAWSPDGTRLAFARELSGSSDFFLEADVYLAAADGSRLRLRAHQEASPRWSPDGARLLMWTTGGHDSYATVALADGHQEPIVADMDARSATWTASGRIAFSSERSTGLFTMRVDGTDRRRVTRTSLGRPAWSPDGMRVAAALGDELVVLDLRTHALRRVTRSGPVNDVAWAPDGRRIAFASASRVGVVAASGGRAVTVVATSATDVAWSPDGRYLSYATASRNALYVVPSDGGPPFRVTHASGPGAWRPCV